MTNFDPSNQTSIARFVLENLPSHKQFALATADDEGKPWVVCLNLSYDNELTLYWQSANTTEHAKHIAARPNVAICVFSENETRGDFGFYAEATAHEITDEAELAQALDVRFTQKGKPLPSTKELLGASPMRTYAARLTKAWVNDDSHIKTAIDLDTLKTEAKQKA